jgi:hypothetical protein
MPASAARIRRSLCPVRVHRGLQGTVGVNQRLRETAKLATCVNCYLQPPTNHNPGDHSFRASTSQKEFLPTSYRRWQGFRRQNAHGRYRRQPPKCALPRELSPTIADWFRHRPHRLTSEGYPKTPVPGCRYRVGLISLAFGYPSLTLAYRWPSGQGRWRLTGFLPLARMGETQCSCDMTALGPT